DDAAGIGGDVIGAAPIGDAPGFLLRQSPRKGRQRQGSAKAEAELSAGGGETGHGVLAARDLVRGSISKLMTPINLSQSGWTTCSIAPNTERLAASTALMRTESPKARNGVRALPS